jgi:ubiquinol-cytochrome c reductase cytochrome b subunit
VKSKADTVPFHPYYTVKDGFAIMAFFVLFAWFVFFAPEALGHVDNQVKANPLVTPAHIVPEWYFLPFYAILRSVPQKLIGVLAMFGAIALLFAVPWLDTSKVKSMRYRPTARWFFLIFIAVSLGLGWCGGKEPDDMVIAIGKTQSGDPTGFSVVWFSRILAIYYYAYFLVILPILGLRETPLPVPASIATPVLGGSAMPAGSAAQAEKKG